uniref:Transcription initiation factor TFIID subunit 8 n=1 Tax=Anolis carolinensis TaxID=28377 RepID=A0A803SXR7_ANOCA
LDYLIGQKQAPLPTDILIDLCWLKLFLFLNIVLFFHCCCCFCTTNKTYAVCIGICSYFFQRIIRSLNSLKDCGPALCLKAPVTNQPVTPKALTAGQNKPHPSHIPGHFPEFPDPHTYIKTPTYREPVLDYQILREKAASQRRDVERALTRFMAKTGETQSLFKDDVSTFPLIAARPFSIPYLTALLPSELEMQQMEETDSSEQDDQTDTENLPLHVSTDDSGAEKENASVLQHNTSLSGSRNGEENLIDNPYLRPVKKPKIRRKK